MAIGSITSSNNNTANNNDPQAAELFAHALALRDIAGASNTATSTGATGEGWPTGTANSLVVKREDPAACGVLVRQAAAWAEENLPSNCKLEVGVTVKADGLPKGNKAVKAWITVLEYDLSE